MVSFPGCKFVSFDRDFLQVISVPCQSEVGSDGPLELSYDCEWLAIMIKTHHLLSTSRGIVSIPSIIEPLNSEVCQRISYVNNK